MPKATRQPIRDLLPTAPLLISAHEAQIVAALRKHESVSRTDWPASPVGHVLKSPAKSAN